MKPANIELLMGHTIGISSNYYKPTESQLLEDYLKAVDLLTINEENKLKKEVANLTNKNREKDYLINFALIDKDKEVENLKKQDKIKEEALLKMSDQIMVLMKDMQSRKKVNIS